MTSVNKPRTANTTTATPTPMPAEAPAVNPPLLLALLATVLELLTGADVMGGAVDEVGDDVAAEEELELDEVVKATVASPKFQPFIWTAITEEPLGPAAAELRNQLPEN
jgi:hypothetical protein